MSGDGGGGGGAGAGVAPARPSEAWPPRPRFGSASVAIADDARGVVAASVQSLCELPVDLPRAALVGGLAVMVRLYEAHRATTDFDEVTESREDAIGLLVAAGAVRTSNGVLFPERGLQLDLLDAADPLTSLTAMVDAVGDEQERRAVQLALVNRYALETAVPTRIFVVRGEEVVASVAIPVAVAGALVAMKAQAATSPDRARDKAAGDIYDAYRLIRAWGPSVIAEDLSRAPVPMLTRMATQIRSLFGEDAERSARALRSASVPGVGSVDIDDLVAAGAVADLLAPFLVWDRPLGA